MEGNEPNLDKLEGLLLASRRTIQLFPRELINKGLSVRLTPARDGKLLDCEYINLRSLPVVDLAAAGIEIDRRSETIFTKVQELLEGRDFRISPNFSLFKVAGLFPKVAEAFAWKLLVIEMQAGSAWRSSSFNPNDELDRFVNEGFPHIGFSIASEEEALKGLDLSNVVEGYMGVILNFVLPRESLIAGTAESDAYDAAIAFSQMKAALGFNEGEYKKYLDENEKKWLFRFFNRKKKWQQRIDGLTTMLAEASSESSKTISTLAA